MIETDKDTARRESSLLKFMSKYSILLILVGLVVIVAILSGGISLRINNLLNVLRQVSVIGIIALGVTMCIITAGIDLSSGAVVAIVSVVVASLLQSADAMDRLFKGGHPWPVGLVLLIGLGLGIAIGFINGAMITKLRIPPFIATLGMMTFARGWGFIYSQGRPRGSLLDSFQVIGQGSILGIPNPAIVLLVCVAITYLILQHTLWGRYTYALGSNLQAAVVSGIKTDRYLILVYTFAGFLAAVASIVLTARIGSGQPGLGLGYELDAIAASVIGGTSLAGGLGSAGGTLVGTLIIGVMKNGLDILNVSADFQQVARAVIIVVAVTIDVRKNLRRA
ncbi:MAG TPA: ABC transporter permease [Anaeromyxobacteraceae bacterium]|nr:ABC transporter permease [Anaeromyxobacteraceae bacterium]